MAVKSGSAVQAEAQLLRDVLWRLRSLALSTKADNLVQIGQLIQGVACAQDLATVILADVENYVQNVRRRKPKAN